jgi:hypothetical protein
MPNTFTVNVEGTRTVLLTPAQLSSITSSEFGFGRSGRIGQGPVGRE